MVTLPGRLNLPVRFDSFLAWNLMGMSQLLCSISTDHFRQTKIHNVGATLVGVDKFGNKYYENLEVQYGRHRWVEYADKGRYNASQVPAEWHGWLHFITDHTGDELLMLKPQRYGLEHKQNFSGWGDEYIYHSKGHSLNPGQRDWTRYQSWQPTKT